MVNTTSQNECEHTEEEFFQRLDSSTFLRRMKIPTEFYTNYIEGKSSHGFFTLNSPLLSEPWKVKIEGGQLKDGWKEFANLNQLKVGNLVHFTHEGDFVFYVTAFTEKGNRILYGDNKIKQLSMKKLGKWFLMAAITLGRKREIVHETAEADNLLRSRSRAGIIKDEGDSSFSRKQTKKGTTSLSVDSDFFYQTATTANLRSSSFYIPMKFSRENRLKQKTMGFVGLVNNAGNVLCGDVTHCSDNRFKIFTIWDTFCSENNVQAGDCSKFRLQPGYEWIMLELVGVAKGGKKSAETKDEQDEVEEDYGSGNDVDIVDLTSEEESTFEKGQCSRKQEEQM